MDVHDLGELDPVDRRGGVGEQEDRAVLVGQLIPGRGRGSGWGRDQGGEATQRWREGAVRVAPEPDLHPVGIGDDRADEVARRILGSRDPHVIQARPARTERPRHPRVAAVVGTRHRQRWADGGDRGISLRGRVVGDVRVIARAVVLPQR